MSRAKRLAIFKAGAAALRRYRPTDEPTYQCPLCGRLFLEGDLGTRLTLEDVPPKSLGGKALVLTCADCNSFSGHTIDAEAHLREQQRLFWAALRGSGSYSGRVRLQLDGEDFNAEIHIRPDRPMEILGAGNSPRQSARLREILDRHVDENTFDGNEFEVTPIDAFHNRAAQISDLKAAFLLVFASLGYRYAFDPRLEIVRRQVLSPDERLIRTFWVPLPQEEDRVIGFLSVPIRFVLVVFGPYAVALPWIEGPADFYGEMETLFPQGATLTLTGKQMPWPSHADFRLDTT